MLVDWDWWTVDVGAAHAGAAGVLGGGEPAPVHFDVASGSEAEDPRFAVVVRRVERE
ncbi:hypothetical protein ACGFNX_38475 [Streptomyces sp. NPDC048723]|uniref:hypothetical protein n=1 Tax=Streptomyces sp. NPDC048723 TaxID=3365589 RepID=UPI00371C9C33